MRWQTEGGSGGEPSGLDPDTLEELRRTRCGLCAGTDWLIEGGGKGHRIRCRWCGTIEWLCPCKACAALVRAYYQREEQNAVGPS